MTRIVNEIRVFVASPSDVNEERENLRYIIEELNGGIASIKRIILRLVKWETDSFPDVGEDSQDVINQQIGPSDIFIGIMWKRIGTPTKRFPSGTIEEFEHAYQMKNKYDRPFHIMFYFNTEPFYTNKQSEIEQFNQVLRFKERYKNLGLYWEYEGQKEFQKLVKKHLEKVIINIDETIKSLDISESEEKKQQRILFESYSEIPFIDIPSKDILKKLAELIELRKNIIVSGSIKYNKREIIRNSMQIVKKTLNLDPKDILYVHNFINPEQPNLLIIPAGKGKFFKKSLEYLIEMLNTNIPELIKSKYYTEKRDIMIEDQQNKQKEILKNFEEEVAKQGFSVIQMQMESLVKPDLVPLIEGKPIPFNKLEGLVKEKKFPKRSLEELKKKYDELTEKLKEIFEKINETDEETKKLLKYWDTASISPIIKGGISEIKKNFPYLIIDNYINGLQEYLIENINLFKKKKKEKNIEDDLNKYSTVKLLVDNSEVEKFPIQTEVAPDQRSLIGLIEYDLASKYSDFRYITPGAFYKAYGGFLILDGNDKYVQEDGIKIIKRSMAEELLPKIPFYPGFNIWPEQPNWDLTILMYAEYKSLATLLDREVELINFFPTIVRIT